MSWCEDEISVPQDASHNYLLELTGKHTPMYILIQIYAQDVELARCMSDDALHSSNSGKV